MSTLFAANRQMNISEGLELEADVILHTGDALNFLRRMPDESIDLVVSSPPYNIGKVYEKRAAIEDYLADMRPVLSELGRVLKNSGSVCWQVGNYVDSGEVFPLDIYYYPMFKDLGLQLRNRIVWHFGHGLHASKRFSGRYETLLWFSKSGEYKFYLDAVRVPAKYPGKTHFKPGKNYGKPSGNPLGKNPSDIWEFVVQEWENELWNIPNCKSNHPEKTDHPCQFPIELVERCVLAFTDAGDRVLDPFGGVGSTALAAALHDRKAVSIEQLPEYQSIALDRFQQLQDGTLRYRPIGKPVHEPTGHEKVAQVPKEWL